MQTNTGIPAVSPEILEEKKLLRQDVMRASLIVVAIQLFANVFSLVCGMAAGVVMGVMSQVLSFSVSYHTGAVFHFPFRNKKKALQNRKTFQF